jgi:hypothetical protein
MQVCVRLMQETEKSEGLDTTERAFIFYDSNEFVYYSRWHDRDLHQSNQV